MSLRNGGWAQVGPMPTADVHYGIVTVNPSWEWSARFPERFDSAHAGAYPERGKRVSSGRGLGQGPRRINSTRHVDSNQFLPRPACKRADIPPRQYIIFSASNLVTSNLLSLGGGAGCIYKPRMGSLGCPTPTLSTCWLLHHY